ncbi:hypothetical protein N0V90_012326 [Kalmusia sp. IMI 367209]|nr:hypothetical protein N0V90_012326 [Kalmusia sp. IMI 367209]
MPYDQEPRHNEKVLRAGLALTIVEDHSTALNPNDVQGHFIIHWQLQKSNGGEVLLKISENSPINLANLMKRSESFHFSKTKNDAIRTPFFDATRLEFEVSWIDDIDCPDVCLPWFDRNDQALITHDMHGGANTINLRLVVDEHGTIELWPALFVLKTLDELKEVRKKPEAASYEEGQILEEALEHLRTLGHPLIRLYGEDMKNMEIVAVPYIRGNLASKTYPIRRTILINFAPVLRIALFPFLFVIRAFSVISQVLLLFLLQCGLACGGIMLSCWLRDGRPEFSQWIQTFWMTRWVFFKSHKTRRVWGPAGPVISKRSKRSEWRDNGVIGLQRPQTVRLERGWDAA